MQFNTLTLANIVIHRVPSRGENDATGPVLSQAPSPDDARVFQFFRSRLSGVMAAKGLPVEPDSDRMAASPDLRVVLDAVGEIIADPTALVSASQRIANRLWDTQDGRNPSGLIVVANGTLDGLACVGILKLEHERGVQAAQDTDEHGQVRFRVILHDDLLLTDHTAVFKGAVLRSSTATDATLLVRVSDLQNQRDVAGFFLRQFLGCKLRDDPPEATRKYFDAAENYINEKVTDPEKRARYEGALLAQMNSSTQTVNPDRFARDNLDASEHHPFLAYLAQRSASTTPFQKDTTRIKGRIRRLSYGFESGIKLVGPPLAMQEHVEVTTGDAQTKVTITDDIVETKGAG